MIDAPAPFACEPQVWTLCFSRKASTRLRSLVAFGRYKHVRAYAYLPGMKAWLFYDVHLGGTTLAVVPDGDVALAVIGEWMLDADLVRIRHGNSIGFPLPGFWCVPAMKHLIGSRSCALRPSALYRWCLRHGGEPFDGCAEVPAITD